MVAVLDLPRDAWADHPNYPHNLLLVRSHASFRELSSTLLRRAEAGGDPVGIVAVFAMWKSAMRGHERYEEGKLYPYLAHRWGIDPGSMSAGHTELHVEDQRVRAAVDTGQDAFVAALRRHHEVLLDHLAHEEAVVIPALLSLSREEFDSYLHHDLRWLRAQHPAAPDETEGSPDAS